MDATWFVVVRHEGRIVHRTATCWRRPDRAGPSRAKPTEHRHGCLATLVHDGKLAFGTPVAPALANVIASAGAYGDRRVTVADLLTHRAGFAAWQGALGQRARRLCADQHRFGPAKPRRFPPTPSGIGSTANPAAGLSTGRLLHDLLAANDRRLGAAARMMLDREKTGIQTLYHLEGAWHPCPQCRRKGDLSNTPRVRCMILPCSNRL